jgi:carbonic anhydrase
LINFDKKVVYQTIQDIVNHKELFFAEGNTSFKRANHYSKKKKQKPDRMVVTSSDEVYLLITKQVFITQNIKTARKLSAAIELMG